MSWAAVAGAVVGGIGAMSSGSNNAVTNTQKIIDPRLANYLYGGNLGGLLGGVNNLYAKQQAQGGLNPLQTAGLEMQRRTLMDPGYSQGYGSARSLGMGLLGQGVAGNPFSAAPTAMPMTAGGLQPNGAPMMTIGPQQGLGLSAAQQPIQQGTAAPQVQANVGPTDYQALIDAFLKKQSDNQDDQQRVGAGN